MQSCGVDADLESLQQRPRKLPSQTGLQMLPGIGGIKYRINMFTQSITFTWLFGKKYFYNKMGIEL